MRNPILEDTLGKVARIIASRADVEIISRGNESPRTDGRRIWLPSLPNPCPPEIERYFHGVLDHEVGHVRHSQFAIIKKFKRKWGEQGFYVLNALEDLRVDHCMENEYPGSKDNLARAYEDCLRRWKENVHRLPLWPRVIGCVIAFGKGWNLDLYGENARTVVSVVEDLILQAPSARSTKAVARLAEQILKRWTALVEPEPEHEISGVGADDKTESAHGRSLGNEASPPEPSESGYRPSEAPERRETHRGASERLQDSNEGNQSPEHGAQVEIATNQKGAGQSLDDARKEVVRKLLGAAPTDEAPSLARHLQQTLMQLPKGGLDIPYRVYDRSHDVIETAPDLGAESYELIMAEVRPHIAGLRQKLLMTMRSKAQNRWVPDQNGHRLDRRRLHTILMDVPSTPPFVRKGEAVNQDCVFSLLVDQSGSMKGQKIRLAQQCSVLLAETLSQLSLPFEVIGFTTSNDRRYLGRFPKKERDEIERQFARYIPTQHLVYKSFNETFRKCKGRFASMEALHYTPLNESVFLAGKRLLEQKASRRVLVVLTDGMTFLGSRRTQTVAHNNLVHRLDLLRKCGVETVAVGVQAPYVKQVFDRAIVIDELADMPKQFYRLMADLVLKSLKKAA